MIKQIFLIIIVILLFYSPLIVNPKLFIERGNDLQEFFWPLFYYVREQIINTRTIPLWNTMFLSGTPLLPDPQSPIFYLPNIIFLLFPINFSFIFSAILHTFWGAVGILIISRKVLLFSPKSCLFTSILYIFLVRNAGYIEAGHFGLILATSWIPFVIYTASQLMLKPTIRYSIFMAISFSSIFFTHTTTYVYSVIAILILIILYIVLKPNNLNKKLNIYQLLIYNFLNTNTLKSGVYIIISFLLLLGLTSVTLLPQIDWIPTTTRSLLSTYREVHPYWIGFGELLKSIWFPWTNGTLSIQAIETEKWLFVGIFPSIIAFYGFKKVNIKLKIAIVISAVLIVLLALNNLSPFYNILLNQKWYVFGRVSTRMWFVLSLIIVFMAGYGLEILTTKKKNLLTNFILIITFLELLVINTLHISKQVVHDRELAPESVYEFLSSNDEVYRVFCVNRCLSQQKVAIYDLETIEGYSTLHQLNYYKHSWQLTGAYWDYYSLTLPPIGTYKSGKLNPNFESLGKYNVKYIVSPYEINSDLIDEVKYTNNYYIYQINDYSPRSFTLNNEMLNPINITNYSPNSMILENDSSSDQRSILVANVFNNDWQATDENGKKLEILETPNSLSQINLNEDTKQVKFQYNPRLYTYGKWITSITLLFILCLLFRSRKMSN